MSHGKEAILNSLHYVFSSSICISELLHRPKKFILTTSNTMFINICV